MRTLHPIKHSRWRHLQKYSTALNQTSFHESSTQDAKQSPGLAFINDTVVVLTKSFLRLLLLQFCREECHRYE